MQSSAPLSRLKPLAAAAFLLFTLTHGTALQAGDLLPVTPEKRIEPESENFLRKMIAEEHFSGVALVMRAGRIIHASGYGKATETMPNGLDTAFHIASVTKQFTAAAILQLSEQEKIDLDASINNYLPAKYRSPNWDRVLVRHLLSHTGGIPDYGITRDYYHVIDGFCLDNTVDGMIREAMSKEPDFRPGSDFKYSNIGFTLLGRIIEEQSGEKYADYMQKHLFTPLGMDHTRIHVQGHVPGEREAEGYRWNEEQGRLTKDKEVTLPVTDADGGMVTTLEDFLKWARTYKNGQNAVLPEDSVEKMTAPSFPFGAHKVWRDDSRGRPYSYGFGLLVGEDQIGHEGYIVGFRSHFIYNRRQDLLVVVFTNNTTNDPYRIATGLFTLHGRAPVQ